MIVRDPPALGAKFIWRNNVHEAFIIESIVASILILLFSTGFIVLYHASKYVYNRKFAEWLLVIGILMIIISFALLQYMLLCKSTEPGEIVCP